MSQKTIWEDEANAQLKQWELDSILMIVADWGDGPGPMVGLGRLIRGSRLLSEWAKELAPLILGKGYYGGEVEPRIASLRKSVISALLAHTAIAKSYNPGEAEAQAILDVCKARDDLESCLAVWDSCLDSPGFEQGTKLSPRAYNDAFDAISSFDEKLGTALPNCGFPWSNPREAASPAPSDEPIAKALEGLAMRAIKRLDSAEELLGAAFDPQGGSESRANEILSQAARSRSYAQTVLELLDLAGSSGLKDLLSRQAGYFDYFCQAVLDTYYYRNTGSESPDTWWKDWPTERRRIQEMSLTNKISTSADRISALAKRLEELDLGQGKLSPKQLRDLINERTDVKIAMILALKEAIYILEKGG